MKYKLEFDDFLPNCGDLFTVEDFDYNIRAGAFTDYDGFGELATNDKVSNIEIHPSTFNPEALPDWCTHIVWYNK